MSAVSFDEFIAQNGEWTAMAIKLPDGTYTRKPSVDHRLRRLLQIAHDTIKKPLADCRVLDLACLEGHYALEFALHGAEAIGIEGRAVNVAKCNFVKSSLGLTRLTFYQDDVRNLSRDKYGSFDIVICSGILYHLKADDAVRFLQSISEVCDSVLLIDTFVALTSQATETIAGEVLHGHHYFEHFEDDDKTMKQSRLWASLDNVTSFWMTVPTLMNLLSKFGFTSVLDVLVPTMPGSNADRKTYIAVKGTPITIQSSDITQSEPLHALPQGKNLKFDASQTPRGKIFRLAKAFLPQRLKNAIKPVLRGVRILPPDTTPEFMRGRRHDT